MTDQTPSLRESVRRGLAGRCPRCGQGALFDGFLKVAPRCESCGHDFAFADSADGPAFFVMSFAGFVVVLAALVVEVVYQPPYWLHALLWIPLILALTHPAAAPGEGPADRAAIPPQGRRRPARRRRPPVTDGVAPTACCCPASSPLAAFAILIALGVWQLERKAWKENLIATLAERMSRAAVAAAAARRMAEPRRPPPTNSAACRMRAQFDPEREARVYTGGAGLRDDVKAPGYFAFAPARLADGSTVVVNRGHVDNPNPDASLKPIAVPDSAVDVVGALRWPEPPGWFVTPYSERQDLWFVRDHRAMAARYGWGEVAPFYIEHGKPGAGRRRAASGPAHGQAAQRPPRLCADLVRAGGRAGGCVRILGGAAGGAVTA